MYDIYGMNANYLWRLLCIREFGLQSDVYEYRRDLDWKTYYFEKKALQKDGSFSWALLNDVKDRPSPRMCHTGTSVSNNWGEFDRVVYIGGQSGQTTRFDDVFVFDSAKFQKINPLLNKQAATTPSSAVINQPPTFARHTSVGIGNKVYSFGGFDGTSQYFGVAVLDLSTMSWSYPQTTGEAPKLKTNHAAAAIGTKMYVYGGNRTEAGEYAIFDELHVLDTVTMAWSKVKTSGVVPGPRVAHKLVAVGKKLYLFGGGVWSPKSDWVERLKKIHILDTDTMVWSCPPVTGEEHVRVSSFSVPLVFSTFIFFFGGQSIQDGNEINDLISFDTVNLSWQRHEPAAHKDNPGQRSVATLNVLGEHAYLFAGSDSFDLSNSVHRLSHPIFKKRKYAKPHA